MFGGTRNQPSTEDRPVLIDGRTGQVIDTDRDAETRDTGRGQSNQDRGSARFIYDYETGRPVPYTPGSEW